MTQTEAPHHSLDAEQVGYKQSLGRRHVQMIAIGGAIGTGLFPGLGLRLHNNGPALLFSYAFVGVIAYFLMRALGELVLHRATSPTVGAVVSMTSRAGVVAGRPPADQDLRAQHRVRDEPEAHGADGHHGGWDSAFRHQPRHLADGGAAVDDQRVPLDQLVNAAVARHRRAAGAPRHGLGQEPGPAAGGESRPGKRCGDARHGGGSDSDGPRTDRALRQHRREAEHPARAEDLVGSTHDLRDAVAEEGYLPGDDDEHLVRRVSEGVVIRAPSSNRSTFAPAASSSSVSASSESNGGCSARKAARSAGRHGGHVPTLTCP